MAHCSLSCCSRKVRGSAPFPGALTSMNPTSELLIVTGIVRACMKSLDRRFANDYNAVGPIPRDYGEALETYPPEGREVGSLVHRSPPGSRALPWLRRRTSLQHPELPDAPSSPDVATRVILFSLRLDGSAADQRTARTSKCTPSRFCRQLMISNRFRAWRLPVGLSMRFRLLGEFSVSPRVRRSRWSH